MMHSPLHTSSPLPGERTALCTALSDDFVPGFAVLIHSLKQHHPELNLPFVIIHNSKLAVLSQESRELIGRLYPHVRFHEADESRYETVWANRDEQLKTPERLKSAFFILEAFGLTEFDRVVTLDSDMICTGSLAPLLKHTASFAATRGINYKTGQLMDYFNSGVMVIGRRHLNGDTYRALLNHRLSPDYNARKGKADQAILNDYFTLDDVCLLDESFNVTKRKYPDNAFTTVDELLAGNVRILHFVGEKPWQLHGSADERNYAKLEAFWCACLQDALPFPDLLRHLRLQQLRLNMMQERQAAVAELKRHAGAADIVITQLLNELDGALPSPKTSVWKWLLALFRRNGGGLKKDITRARKKWSRQHTKLERKLSAITESP